VHTSGTSAEPKGVLHRHGAIARHSWRMAHEYWLPIAGDIVWSPRPWFWVAGLVADLLYTLQVGATFVVADVTDADDPSDLVATIRRERVTYLGGPWSASLRLARAPAFAAAGLSAIPLSIDLAGVAHTGDTVRFVSVPLEHRLPAVDASAIPPSRLPNLFGMTETLGTHCALPHGTVLPRGAEGAAGPPVPGIEVRLADLDDGGPVTPGADGLLWVRGENLMLGLHRRARAEVFDADGWYPTGDICQVDERGWVRFRSRADDVVKISGANVAPLEVERVLADHPGVRDVSVVGTLVGSTPTLVAAVVPHEGVALDAADLCQFARRELSSYKVPRHVISLTADELPRTSSGKVRKDELRRLVDRRLSRGEAQ
jgi:acyl-coenzyme A synthetase/AMP-(fatty) acid ligase